MSGPGTRKPLAALVAEIPKPVAPAWVTLAKARQRTAAHEDEMARIGQKLAAAQARLDIVRRDLAAWLTVTRKGNSS